MGQYVMFLSPICHVYGEYGVKNHRWTMSGKRSQAVLLTVLLTLVIPTVVAAQSHMANGSYSGDGSASQAIAGLGFQPDLVIIKAATAEDSYACTKDMPAGFAKNLAQALALQAGLIESLDTDGFTVGADAAVNSEGVEYYWVAMNDVGGSLETGQYVGDGAVNNTIPLTNMYADGALVMAAEAELPVFHHVDMPDWRAYGFDGGGKVNNSIGYFVQDGMVVSNSLSTNGFGKMFYYVAWNAGPGTIVSGNYAGNDQPGRDLTGLGLNPDYVLIASDASVPAIHRPSSLTGDASLSFNQQSARNNLVQAVWDGGFQVGTDPAVNSSGTNYYWLAFADPGLTSDLSISVTPASTTRNEGDTVTYLVSVSNPEAHNASGVQASFLLPTGVTFESAIPFSGTTYDEVTGVWDIDGIGDGSFRVLTVTGTVDAGTSGSILTSTASVTASALPDLNPLNDTMTIELTVLAATGADLHLAMTVDDAAPDEGQTITYVVSVRNDGPDDASNVVINDSLPGTLSVLSATPSQGTYNQGNGNWDLAALIVGETQTLTIDASVHSSTSGDTISNVAAMVSLDQVDPTAANDSAAVDIIIDGLDMQVSKFVDNALPAVGDTVIYTVLATNLGPAAGTVTQIVDLLPAGVTLQAVSFSVGSYDGVNGIWNIVDIAANATETLTLVTTVDVGTEGNTISNTAAVSSVAQLELNASNDSSTVDIVVGVTGGVDLQLTQTVDNTAPNVGETILYAVTVLNAGVGGASGIEVSDLLPVGVSYVTALANKGSYDQGTGIWTIGDLAEGFQAVLNIQASVDQAAAGATVTNTASISAADQIDTNAGNNSASTDINVPTSDLQLSKTVNNSTPAVGDTITYTLILGNNGPNPATGIVVSDLLPAAVSFVSANPALGSYDAVTGLWDVGNLNPALSAFLTIDAVILPAGASAAVLNTAAIYAVEQADPDSTNNNASAVVTVAGTDLALDLVSDVAVAIEGSDLNLTLTVANEGLQDATGIEVTYKVPAGLTVQSMVPSQGAYSSVTGIWTTGDVAQSSSANLQLTVRVNAGTAGSTIGNSATITAADPTDPNPANDTATTTITIWTGIPSNESILWPLVGTTTVVLPGAITDVDVLTFSYVNRGAEPDTLHGMTVMNLTEGSGTLAQMDAEWASAQAFRNKVSTGSVGVTPLPVAGQFVDGQLLFDRLDWAVPVGDTLIVTVRGAASLQARDAALLKAGITSGTHLIFNDPYTLVGSWPLVSGQGLEVDGFVVAQAAVIPRESGLLAIGSQQNLALTVDLPGNGYLDDVLYGLSVANNGSAQPVTDITGIEAWADDGDGLFDALTDVALGQTTYSGDRWQLTGLDIAVPAGGRRFYFTVDIAETAQPSSEIRLGLPVGNGFAVEMFSGNDGPVDAPLENPNTLGISATDRVILTSEWFRSGVALPGTNDAPLLQFVLTNTYTTAYQLQDLTFTNTSLAAGATALQRDALCQQVDLWLEGPTTDTRLASGIFLDDRITFAGLDLELPADMGIRLYVTADLGLTTVADGNLIRGRIESIADIGIPNANIAASWPLESDVEWLINGMTAEQISRRDISALTLGPSEGPVLAMDLTIPSDGYADDVLSGITLSNEGSATAADIETAELWADGGDGVFDAGAGDDVSLGPLTVGAGAWVSNVLSWPVPTEGLQLFASLTVAATPQDSVTVKLGLPIDGITVSSGNDGPVDQPLASSGTLVISTSPLRTALMFVTAATDTGQTGTVNMTVHNAGSEPVTDILPSLEFTSGGGLLVLGTPTPATIPVLNSGAETTISWPYVSAQPGEVVLEGNAQGLVNGDQVRRSIVTQTSAHRIYTPVPLVELYPTANLPFSINRGQQGLVPLTLTFVNAGDADVADAHLTSIRLRFQEAVDGPDIAPADLVDQIVVAEGTNVYLETTTLPTTGSEVDLVFSEPVVITGAEPVTLGLRLDLRLNSTVPSFLVSIEDATWLVGNDAINGANLLVAPGEGAFPVRTGQATLVSPAVGLNVAVAALDTVETVPGQTDILLAEISLTQSVADDNSSSIDVGRLAFEFHGADGLPLADPAQRLSQLSLRSAFQEHYVGALVTEGDSLVVLSLSAPVTITGNATLVLRLYGDIAADSPLGEFTSLLGSVDQFDARDGNMNNPVPVILTTNPSGPVVNVLGPATFMTVGGTGMMPNQVSRGTRDLTAMNLTMSNPGEVGTSDVAGDSITLRFFNAARQPQDPGVYLDRIRILREEIVMGFAIDPVAADGIVKFSVAGGELAPGQSANLRVSLDFKPDSPAGTLEVVLEADDVQAVDAINGAVVPTRAAAGTSLPLSSGVGSIVIPADELVVAQTNLMPPLLAPAVEGIAIWELSFSNPAPAGSGDVVLNSLTLSQSVAKALSPDLNEILSTVQVRLGEVVIASTSGLEITAASVTLVPETMLVVGAGETLNLQVEIFLRDDAKPGALQLSLDESGIGAGPPGGVGLPVRVLPDSGYLFPFVTKVGNVGSANLSDSYANFPNPFAAGREPTTFAFFLLRPAQVKLRIVTPHGELVATILQDEHRAPGLHQSDVWPGLNGNGRAVHNGVYLAELDVLYDDGTRERILRKVAVVR